MARRNQKIEPLTVEELRENFLSFMAEDFSKAYGVKDIFEIWTASDGNHYVKFVTVDNKLTDRLRYTYQLNGQVYNCDHVVHGADLDEIYRDLEFMEVNFIFGYIYDSGH